MPRSLTHRPLQDRALGGHIKSFGEIQVEHIHHSPHINQGSNFVINGDQVCPARFALGESMLAPPNPMLRLTCDGLQEDVFPIFSGTEVRLMCLKFPESFFNPCPQIRVKLAFFQSSGISPSIHNHSEIMECSLPALSHSSLNTLSGTMSGLVDHWGPSPCHRLHTNPSFPDSGSVFASAWGFVPKVRAQQCC